MISRISHFTFHISYFIFILLASCADPKVEEKKLSEEVMTAHDRSMMLMDEMNTLELKLTEITKKDSTQTVAAGALKQLQAASEGMMDWMHGFNADYDKLSHEEIIKYLNSEKGKIEQIEIKMKESIANAKKI